MRDGWIETGWFYWGPDDRRKIVARRKHQADDFDVSVADSIGAVEAHQAVQEDNDQAELSDGAGDAAGDGVLDKNAQADGPTNAEVEAANKARLARGEEPVAEASEDPLPKSAAEEFGEDSAEASVEGVGEDTMAVRQSHVDRVIDGDIVRANENPATQDIIEGTPDTKGTSRDQ